MRLRLLILASLFFSVAAKAADPMWFVSVHGESMQLISGASATAKVEDGVYLGSDYAGTEIYVRVQEGYELDGFRPYDSAQDSAQDSDTDASVGETMDASAQAAAPKEQAMDEFGPLSDSGLQYYLEHDYFGWICAQLFVQPLGDRVYRLRCTDTMKHSG